MELKSKYEMEIDNFRRVFADKKDKSIAIYGLGRRSATLLPGITDYKVVGLLDRDESNIGKILCGIKVISISNIENVADIIIINSDPSNYEIIYKRIARDVTIPIYYADGRLAHMSVKNADYENNPYWSSSFDELKSKVDSADIVSFDIFDTLIMRKIFSPEDVFRLLGEKVKAKLGINDDIAQIRSTIASGCTSCASIDELYELIKEQTNLTDKNIEDIKKIEKDTDIELCIAREDIANLYEYCISSGKEVYLISDMYYTPQDIKIILIKCGLTVIDDEHIWISCDKRLDKISGSMWKKYAGTVGNEMKCLHIGDNKKGDIENSEQYGIESFYVMSGKDMLMNSSISELASYINTVSDSMCLGLVVAKLFNSPFELCKTKGKVSFNKTDVYGYCVYAPLLAKFLIWLYFNSRNDGIDKLLLFARDGYFLEKDYSILSELLNDGYKQEWCYFPISRRLIYIATLKNEDDLKRVISFPYVGTFAEYMKSRFDIAVTDVTAEYNDRQINAVGDSDSILKWIKPYKEDIMREAAREREDYMRYLKADGDLKQGITYGTVDLGYYGTNQYYLQMLTGIKTEGYCFYSCLSDDNVYIKDISMKGCFQYSDDYKAERSKVKKKNMQIETFLTAPHGMIRYIDEQYNMICEPNKKSQYYFDIKQQVNNGVVEYINDYVNLYKNEIIYGRKEYIKQMQDRKEGVEDVLFYNMLNGECNVSDSILAGFYFDNDFVGGREVQLET